MAAGGKLTRSTWVLLFLLCAVLLWTRSMDSKTKALRAKAAAAMHVKPPADALGTSAAPAVGGPRPEELASLRIAPWSDDPFFKTESAGWGAAHASRHARRQAWRPTGKGLQLNGILYSGANSSAQICDRVAGIGETVYGWRVLNITENSVTLTDRGTVITLHLHEGTP